MKTICIYHSIDLDGWMSAAIVKYWFLTNIPKGIILDYNSEHEEFIDSNYLYMIGFNYGDEVPNLSEYDKVIMCDISFPPEEMFRMYYYFDDNNFIWLDHHISSISDSEGRDYESCEGLRDTKFAACELTWKYFFPNEPIPEIVRLLGRYDCFGHKGTDEEIKVLEFQYGARQCISNYEEAYYYLRQELIRRIGDIMVPTNSTWEYIHQQGKAIYQYLCTEAKWIYKMGREIHLSEKVVSPIEAMKQTGLPTMFIPRKFLAINRSRFNPINFGIDYHKDGYDGIMCWNLNKDKFTASLYNDNGLVDCSTIAKNLGGGGHRGAAGFVMEDIEKLKLILNLS